MPDRGWPWHGGAGPPPEHTVLNTPACAHLPKEPANAPVAWPGCFRLCVRLRASARGALKFYFSLAEERCASGTEKFEKCGVSREKL